VVRRRRRVQGGRKARVFVRFTEEEFAQVQAAADEAGVTASNLVAESALVMARRGRAADDGEVLDELRAMRQLLHSYGGRLIEVADAQSEEFVRRWTPQARRWTIWAPG
jgi:molybdopterin biosynthesis enzyme